MIANNAAEAAVAWAAAKVVALSSHGMDEIESSAVLRKHVGRVDDGGASISAPGAATAQAHQSKTIKPPAGPRAQTEVWGGDLLLISIPDAAPDQLTEVRFIVESRGVVSPAGGNAALWLCFGLRNSAQGACPDKLSRQARNALHLPYGVNVVVPGHAKSTAGAGESWRHRQTVVMTMRGSEALVPFWYYLQARTGGPDANGSRAQVLSMSIELPEGAMCASRTRTAFGGACPKRKGPAG